MRLAALSPIAMALLLGAAAPVHAEAAAAPAGATAKPPADKPAPRSFAGKPTVGARATCPVSGETFTVKKGTQSTTYKGRTYAFCCPDCKGDFAKDPEKFADKAAGKR